MHGAEEVIVFIEDLSAYQYRLPFPLEDVRCVGWLDSEHQYETGRAPGWLTEKLESIMLRRDSAFDAHVNVVRGIHPCKLCGRDVELTSGGRRTPLGMSEIWLPSDPGWLAAPSLVIHYVKDHGYLPPSAFVRAVGALDAGGGFLGQEVYDRLVGERTGG
jgi:hypothetical protein